MAKTLGQGPSGPSLEIVKRPFVVPSERLVLSISMFGVQVGRIEMRSGRPGVFNGRPASMMWSETRTDGLASLFVDLREEVSTTFALDDGLPIKTLGSFAGLFRNRAQKPFPRSWPARGPRWHNVHTAFSSLRAWVPPRGTRGYFRGQVGWRRHEMTVTAAGREVLRSERGPVPVVRYEGSVKMLGSSRGLRYVLWITDDRNRSLYRLHSETELGGTVVVQQIAYHRPD